uniref:Uncharacterized protein n=2 Tax=Micrurus corallinus TaxID=54390 RepID=A0A2D4FZ20_MICCO
MYGKLWKPSFKLDLSLAHVFSDTKFGLVPFGFQGIILLIESSAIFLNFFHTLLWVASKCTEMAAMGVGMISHNTCLLEYKRVKLLPNSPLVLQKLSTIAVQLFLIVHMGIITSKIPEDAWHYFFLSMPMSKSQNYSSK